MTRFIRVADAIHAVADSSRLGRSIAWNFVKGSWRQIPATRSLYYAIKMYVSPVVEKFSSTFRYNDVYQFLKSKFPKGKLSENAEDLLRKIQRNVQWRKKEAPHIELWLDNYNNSNKAKMS